MDKKLLAEEVKATAHELGYDLCGIMRADTIQEYITYLDDRIKNFPGSRHLYEDLYDLAYPGDKVERTKSVIVCIRTYSRYNIPPEINKYIAKYYLFDRRLEYSSEYAQDESFEKFLSAMGMRTLKNEVSARWAAVKAGLGTFGHNNFIYTRFGSWIWIDTWIVDMEMQYDEPSPRTVDCPPNCRRCVEACPTKALSAPLMMDMGKCVAQLSYYSGEIYPNELIPEPLREQMGTWVYGCDICQEVCPRNKSKWSAKGSFPGLDELVELVKLENIVRMDEKTFLDIIQPRFSYIGQDGLWIWKCNALQAMTNSGDIKYHECIREACTDENTNVREMAEWACKKLNI